MKRTCLITILIILLTTGCNHRQGNKQQSAIQERQEENTTSFVEHLTTEQFNLYVMDTSQKTPTWKTQDEKPEAIVLDFYATWCGPCKAMAPIMENVAKDYRKKARFYKIDIDECPELADYFGIESIPTFYFVSAKGDVHKITGGMEEEELRDSLEVFLQVGAQN